MRKHLIVNIDPNLSASIPESKTSFQNYIRYNGPCLSTINLTAVGLENAFASLKTNKSSGYDDISANVVKRVSDEIFVILKHTFNISLAKGVFPGKLKIARLTPIFKKGNNTLVTNYRPISVLPCFSKSLERIMYNRLYKFLLENKFFMNASKKLSEPKIKKILIFSQKKAFLMFHKNETL